MIDDTNKTLKALHDLVATCNDASEGYGKAAKGVHNRQLSDWLAEISDKRQRFGSELTGAIQELGGEARLDLHEGGILHRGWVDLEQRIQSKDEHEILRECLAGDSGTLKHYDHALGQNLSNELKSKIEEQRAAVEKDLVSVQSRADLRKSHYA